MGGFNTCSACEQTAIKVEANGDRERNNNLIDNIQAIIENGMNQENYKPFIIPV